MRTSDALWEVFSTTGHIGAYLLYTDFRYRENEFENSQAATFVDYCGRPGL